MLKGPVKLSKKKYTELSQIPALLCPASNYPFLRAHTVHRAETLFHAHKDGCQLQASQMALNVKKKNKRTVLYASVIEVIQLGKV